MRVCVCVRARVRDVSSLHQSLNGAGEPAAKVAVRLRPEAEPPLPDLRLGAGVRKAGGDAVDEPLLTVCACVHARERVFVLVRRKRKKRGKKEDVRKRREKEKEEEEEEEKERKKGVE